MYIKPDYHLLKTRATEPRKFIQVIIGPRQIGKTTLIKTLVKNLAMPIQFVSADGVPNTNFGWISNQWETLRLKMNAENAPEAILIIDEIQKIENWAEIVKAEWDKDSFDDVNIKLILLGSATLMIQKGLTESLAGRFELINMTHWTYQEMHDAFGWSIQEFVYFGGYPGAASLINEENRWRDYVLNSLVETTISKDILMQTRIDKPAVLRRLFELGSSYSGQIVSVTEILGELQNGGNSTTLSGYVALLDSAGLLSGLERYSPELIRQRASIPKWQVQNTAFSSALNRFTFNNAKMQAEVWGRFVETAVGAYLCKFVRLGDIKLFYWREGNYEVDFVLERRGVIIGLEVKAGRTQTAKGIQKFIKNTKPYKTYVVGNSGIPWQDFLKLDIKQLF